VLSATSMFKLAASLSFVFCKIKVVAIPFVESKVVFSWKLIPASGLGPLLGANTLPNSATGSNTSVTERVKQ